MKRRIAIFMAVLMSVGCMRAISADDAYAAEIAACSSTAATKAEAKACRDGVNRKYGLCDNPDAWPRIIPCPDKTSQEN